MLIQFLQIIDCSCAKKLIEDTIRRNASPVRSLVNLLGGGDCEPGQDIMDIAVNTEDEAVIQNSKNRSASDSAVEEYNYSVSIGNEILKISGMNLNYVTVRYSLFFILTSVFKLQYFKIQINLITIFNIKHKGKIL